MWCDMIWYDTIWYDTIWYMIWYDTIRYDTIRYDTIRYDMIWYLNQDNRCPGRDRNKAPPKHKLKLLLLEKKLDDFLQINSTFSLTVVFTQFITEVSVLLLLNFSLYNVRSSANCLEKCSWQPVLIYNSNAISITAEDPRSIPLCKGFKLTRTNDPYYIHVNYMKHSSLTTDNP